MDAEQLRKLTEDVQAWVDSAYGKKTLKNPFIKLT